MKLDKHKLTPLLAQWMKWDLQLQKNLRDIQLKLLFERIIEEKTFSTLSKAYKVQEHKLRIIFSALLFKIERSHGKALATLLREINTQLEAIEKGIYQDGVGFQIGTVFLN